MTTATRRLKVLALTRYGRQGASSRMRTFQYLEPLGTHGIDFDIQPLLGQDYLDALYGGGGRVRTGLRGILRRMRSLRSARSYDAVWVKKEALPWLPAFLELGLVPRDVPLLADYDDAVFHHYDQHRSTRGRIAGALIVGYPTWAPRSIRGRQHRSDRVSNL